MRSLILPTVLALLLVPTLSGCGGCGGDESLISSTEFAITDLDGDGVPNHEEDINGDGDYYNDDSDGDGTPNLMDTDDDGDGVPSSSEDVDGDGDPTNDDSDGDGTPNYLDTDDDGDGTPTINEDADGDGDASNDDVNDNGVPDYLEQPSKFQYVYMDLRNFVASSEVAVLDAVSGSVPSLFTLYDNPDTETMTISTDVPVDVVMTGGTTQPWSVSLERATLAPGELATGGRSASGSLAGFATSTDGAVPGMGTWGQLTEGLSPADIVGPYHLVGLYTYGDIFGTVNFDGAGAGTWSGSNMFYFSGSPEPSTSPVTYTIDASGAATMSGHVPIDWDDAAVFSGGVTNNGEVLMFGGGKASSEGAMATVVYAFPRSASADSSILNGQYTISGLGLLSARPTVSISGVMTANGDGTASATVSRNSGGTITTGITMSFTYTVGADGTLILTDDDGYEYTGGITSSGEFAAASLSAKGSSTWPRDTFTLTLVRH